MASTKKITLKSSDGKTVVVEDAVALQSQVIKHMIEDDCADNEIPLLNVTGDILDKVIEFCKVRAWDPECKAWDTEFVEFYQAEIFGLILAANYLNIPSLLDLTCISVANRMAGKTPEEIRKTFNIKNDFTPEEQEEMRREQDWASE